MLGEEKKLKLAIWIVDFETGRKVYGVRSEEQQMLRRVPAADDSRQRTTPEGARGAGPSALPQRRGYLPGDGLVFGTQVEGRVRPRQHAPHRRHGMRARQGSVKGTDVSAGESIRVPYQFF